MTHDSFSAWVEAEVLHIADSQKRLDGWERGSNLAIHGRFKHQGRSWEVHGDTHIEKVRRAYNAIQNGRLHDPLVAEPAKKRDCLNLVKSLRKSDKYKYFYVYETYRRDRQTSSTGSQA